MPQTNKLSKPAQITADGRWCSFGPYYAMFPIEFALNVINQYTRQGDLILDPFGGRGTSAYAASMLGRHAVGIEISPVGWLFGSVKLSPSREHSVVQRIRHIGEIAKKGYVDKIGGMDEFFYYCYTPEVLSFLLAARDHLNWKNNKVDATLMGLILVSLHGKRGQSLSNQMQQVKACGLKYAVRWWKKNDLLPPEINPVSYLIDRVRWRYKFGRPKYNDSKFYFGDSTEYLKKPFIRTRKFDFLLTSPPYYGITDYHWDQWLRLWMLGGEPYQKRYSGDYTGRFGNKEKYIKLLENVFGHTKHLLSNNATVYVRTDARETTLSLTIEILSKLFPKKDFATIQQPLIGKSTTHLHGDTSKKPGEVDIILRKRTPLWPVPGRLIDIQREKKEKNRSLIVSAIQETKRVGKSVSIQAISEKTRLSRSTVYRNKELILESNKENM